MGLKSFLTRDIDKAVEKEFRKMKDVISVVDDMNSGADETLESLLSGKQEEETITKEMALEIPTVAACVDLISKTISSLPIYLFEDKGNETKEVENDSRVTMLNGDTGDTLNGHDLKKAMITDFLLEGNAYTYINRNRNKIESLNYVDSDCVFVMQGLNPIFKDYKINVMGENYEGYQFLKLLNNSKDGSTGDGILERNQEILRVAYGYLKFEYKTVARGGNKKGFLKASKALTKDAMDALKAAWNKLYKTDEENVMILNEGMDFINSSATSVELQMNENKKTNSQELSSIFNVPTNILSGNFTKEQYNVFIKLCIFPILQAFVAALNKDLLLHSEKKRNFYFAFDTSELLKGSEEERFKAYNEALKGGWMVKNEVRYKEDLPPIEGLDIITLSLGDVIFDANTGTYFIPNTLQKDNTSEAGKEKLKGGDIVED